MVQSSGNWEIKYIFWRVTGFMRCLIDQLNQLCMTSPSVEVWRVSKIFFCFEKFSFYKYIGRNWYAFEFLPVEMTLCKNDMIQLNCRSARRTRIINLPTNQKGCDTFETTVGKLLARRIQIFPVPFLFRHYFESYTE